MANFLKKAVQKVTNTVLDNRLDAAQKEVAKSVGATQAAAMRSSIVSAMTKPGSDLAKKINEVNNVGTAAAAISIVGLAAVGAGAAGVGAAAGGGGGGGAAAAGGGGVVKAVGGVTAIGGAAKPLLRAKPGAETAPSVTYTQPVVTPFETKQPMLGGTPVSLGPNYGKPGTSVVETIQQIPVSTLPINKPVGLLNTIETAGDKINAASQTYIGQAVKSIAGSALQGFLKPKVTTQTQAVNQVAQDLAFMPQITGGGTLNEIANAIGNGPATNAAFGVNVSGGITGEETFWDKYKWAIIGLGMVLFPFMVFALIAMSRRRR